MNEPKTPKLYWLILMFVALIGFLSGVGAIVLTIIAPADDLGRYASLIATLTKVFENSVSLFCGLIGGRGLSQWS